MIARSGVLLAAALGLGSAAAVGPPPVGDGVTTALPQLPTLPALPEVTQPETTTPKRRSDEQSATAASSQSVAVTQVAHVAQVARSITTRINRLRRARGLRPLRSSTLLVRAGAAHAAWLASAGAFTHDWPQGTPFARWIPSFYPATGFRRWDAGENLLWRSPEVTADEAVAMWLASPPHRRNLLSRAWREVGVGVVRADGAAGVYAPNDPVVVVAAEFGRRVR
jgi:uncharacterized protein YkwD